MSKKEILTGKRKRSIARVKIVPGNGKILVNKKGVDDYLQRHSLVKHGIEPLEIVEMRDKLDVSANIVGGGKAGQAGALRLAIARALVSQNEEFRGPLKKAGMLRRDAREVERKKYGLHKARKATQFSKR